MRMARSSNRVRLPRARVSAAAVMLSVVVVAVVTALVIVAARGSAPPSTFEERVRAVASTLRCTVCQGLSVADSPSPVAREMRATIARQLREGRTPDEVRGALVAAYSEWILLSPPRQGLGLVVWLAPAVLLVAGIAVVATAVRRWAAPGTRAGTPSLAPAAGSAASPGLVGPAEPDRRLLERALAEEQEEPD